MQMTKSEKQLHCHWEVNCHCWRFQIFRLLHRLDQQRHRKRICLTWSAFAKLKPILTSPKPTMKFKMHLFKAACTSILLYGCEAWVLTQTLTAKLDKFARKCYQIMLGICQAETHMTNTDLYHMADEHLISETIRECQLHFTRHSAFQSMNLLTFMLSIRARSGDPTTMEIQASHISTKYQNAWDWQNSKTLSWRDCQLCQG